MSVRNFGVGPINVGTNARVTSVLISPPFLKYIVFIL